MAFQKKLLSGAYNQSTGQFVVVVSLSSTSNGTPEVIPDFAEVPIAITGTPNLATIKSQVDVWAAKVEAFQEAKANEGEFTAPW